MIQIEKNIPVPARGARASKYPFADMVVGDSFAAPVKPMSMYQAANKWAKRHGDGAAFIVRPEGDGCRVWRTE